MDRILLNTSKPYTTQKPQNAPSVTLPTTCVSNVCLTPTESVAQITTSTATYETGTVSYTLQNNTDRTTYVSIWRGVPDYSPLYFFGGAFGGAVYIANGLPVFGDTTATTAWGILQDQYGKKTNGFIYTLKPHQTYTTVEYGFPTSKFNLLYQPVIVNPGKVSQFIVFYDPALVLGYELETGISVNSMPDPFQVVTPLVSYVGPYSNQGYFMLDLNTTNVFQEGIGLLVKTQLMITDLAKVINKWKNLL